MLCICIALGAYALGLFTACFLYGWFENSMDKYAAIAWQTPTRSITDGHPHDR